MLSPALQRVASEFVYARGRRFAGNALASFIRQDLAAEARRAVSPDFDDLLVKASAGQAAWAAVPWLAFFDPLITTSAQRGYYVVYLFDAQMEGLYLSLNQGTTAVDREFGKRLGRSILRERAQSMRIRLSDVAGDYSATPINLKSPADLPTGYEAGHAMGFSYDLGNLPSDDQLIKDLTSLLRAYRTLTQRGGLVPSELLLEEAGTQVVEEARRYIMSRRLERHSSVRRQVLRVKKPACEACGLDPRLHFNLADLAHDRLPLDVHHLHPLSRIAEGEKMAYEIPGDFAVLCATCHRVAHMQDDPGDMDVLRERVRFKHAELVMGI